MINSLESSPWPFFAIALGWSWLFWIPLALPETDVTTMPGVLVLAIGGLGPAISAIFLTYAAQGVDQRKDYWKRVIGFSRIPPKWYATIFLIPPLYSILALATGLVFQKSLPFLETPAKYLHNPLSILPFAVVTLFYGPLPEELGWRGYALDRLQRKWNALSASVILGIIWSTWHLPMFFIKGSLQAEIFPFASSRFWIAMGLEFWQKQLL